MIGTVGIETGRPARPPLFLVFLGALIGLGRSEGGVLRPLRLTQAADLHR